MLEIEAKIKVDSLAPIAQRLGQLEAHFVAELIQNDVYFVDAGKKMFKRRCGLRLRTETTKAETVSLITFKGPTQKSPYKSRAEYETRVADVKSMQSILEGLGYRAYLTVAKTRDVWQMDNCEICLDNLPLLGCFVEVEGADETVIKHVLTQLGLGDQPHIREGYAAMTAKMEKENKHNR